MSHILKTVGKTPNIPLKHFLCDEIVDIANIDTTYLPMGSTVYVINVGDTYILNSVKQWKKMTTSSGSSSGGDSSAPNPDDTYIYDGGGVGGY